MTPRQLPQMPTQYRTAHRHSNKWQCPAWFLLMDSGSPLRSHTKMDIELLGVSSMRKIGFDDKIWCEDDACQEEGESVFKRFSRRALDHALATHLETTELFITCLTWNSIRNSTNQIKESKQRLICENVYKNVQDCNHAYAAHTKLTAR